MKIPFNKPSLVGNETDYLAQCIKSMHTAGDGNFTKKRHRLLAQSFNVEKALLTTSCTDPWKWRRYCLILNLMMKL